MTVELEPIVEEPPTSEITIRVVNSDSEPIEGATVPGEGQPHEADIPLEFSGETDSNGEYSDVIYENEYVIEVVHPDYSSNRVEYSHRRDSEVVVSLRSAEGDDGSEEPAEGIEIEYSVSEPMGPGETPDEVIEHPNPDGFEWVAIEFELLSGSFDAKDIMGLTQVDTGDQREFTRAVEIVFPDETLITDPEESYMMEEGTEGVAYYRIEEGAEPRVWVIEQLENKHGDVEATSA